MNTNKIIITNAFLITLAIGGFFFLCKFFDLHENPYLRFFNLFFVYYGTRLAIKTNINENNESRFIVNFGIGIQTAALAVLLSIVGVISYITFINPSFLDIMDTSFLIGGNLSLAEVFFSLFIEGIASAFIASFIVMMYFKNHERLLAKA